MNLTYNAIYYGYLKAEGKRLSIKVTLITEGIRVLKVHIQDHVLYSFADALHCLQKLGRDVMTGFTDEELKEMAKKGMVIL